MKLKQIVLTIIFTFTGLILLPHMHTEAAQIGIGTEKKIVQNPLQMKREAIRLEKEKQAAKRAEEQAKQRAAEQAAQQERERQAKAEQEAKQKKETLEKAEAQKKQQAQDEAKRKQQENQKEAASTVEPKKVAAKNETGGRQETFETTAYTNDAALNGSYDGKVLTASGYDVTHTIHFEGRRIVAVDPNVIPLGTKVHVEGFGDAIALDTGGVIHGKIMDLMMETEQEAINWGRRSVQVTIYE
ncbi:MULTISPECIES: 3D domain-containing protein [unclassified Exiguobacterium]|uniref:3D domain-containing protein n=1 Tax=unclassified Exiguobacterium TaxID=2644629 RepID=UPI000B58F65C|nr:MULTISPECIES: 3D domain-containing protein [unclassified Exiguobacterium]ASI35625.1 murein transglycosylase [Exiguobacterium sp. N4-1P]